MIFAAFVIITFWQGRNDCISKQAAGCYPVRDPFDLAIVAAAFAGACAGFLWWNAAPARIFMGDTGSLALGGALAGMAIITRTELLLAVLGGLFVVITMSSIIQIGYFKMTHRRVFKMAPLQHHFELKGWAEVTIVIRFWITRRTGRRAGPWRVLRRVDYMAALVPSWVATATHDAPWHELAVCVAGVGVSGAAAARVLNTRGASVVVVDAGDGPRQQQAAAELAAAGIDVRLGDGDTLPDGTQLVVTSPGWRRESALFAAAAARGLSGLGRARACMAVARAGRATVVGGDRHRRQDNDDDDARVDAACGWSSDGGAGNIGTPLVDMANAPLDVLAVEFGSFQLHWSPSVVPLAAAVLNVAPDHLDWWGDSFDDYVAAKGLAFAHPSTCAIGNADDASARRLLARAPGRRVSFTLHSPRPHQLGVVDDLLIDRAFVDDAENNAVELATLADLTVPGAHNVANALAAAALARAFGVAPAAIAEGLRTFTPAPHRIAEVAMHRRRAIRRRLEGNQSACGRGVSAFVRLHRVDRRRPREGHCLRRRRARRGPSAARRGRHRCVSARTRRRTRATRPRCPRGRGRGVRD